jgi:hypothetical protein
MEQVEDSVYQATQLKLGDKAESVAAIQVKECKKNRQHETLEKKGIGSILKNKASSRNDCKLVIVSPN